MNLIIVTNSIVDYKKNKHFNGFVVSHLILDEQ